jgi:hypothetical protein
MTSDPRNKLAQRGPFALGDSRNPKAGDGQELNQVPGPLYCIAPASTAESEAIDELCASLQGAILNFRRRIQITSLAHEPVARLDFSINVLMRKNRQSVPLPPSIPIRMLEQMARRPVLSACTFLLLLRCKLAVVYNEARSPEAALRHELSVLRRKVEEMDLPIEIQRSGRAISARFDTTRIKVNVMDAKLIAKQGSGRIEAGDFSGATELIRQALAADFDCAPAIGLLTRILRTEPNHLTAAVIVPAEICLARAMLRHAAAVQRLRRSKANPDIAKARRVAERMLIRQRWQWLMLGSWSAGESPQDQAGRKYRAALRELLEVVIDARSGGQVVFDRFAKNPIVIEVMDHLLAGRLLETDQRKRDSLTATLRVEVFSKLVMSAWQPAPAASQQEFQERLIHFLQARRIDWSGIFSRSSSRTARLRDDLHPADDGDDDDAE